MTAESTLAGRNAGLNAQDKLARGIEHKVTNGNGIRYVVPNSYYEGEGDLDISFRVTKKFVNCSIVVSCDGKEVLTKNVIALKPSELETIKVNKSNICGNVTISIKERV